MAGRAFSFEAKIIPIIAKNKKVIVFHLHYDNAELSKLRPQLPHDTQHTVDTNGAHFDPSGPNNIKANEKKIKKRGFNCDVIDYSPQNKKLLHKKFWLAETFRLKAKSPQSY